MKNGLPSKQILLKFKTKLENTLGLKVIMIRVNQPFGEIIFTTEDQADHVMEAL